MAWRRSGDKPLSESMLVSLPTHICFTRPQWVNLSKLLNNRVADDLRCGAHVTSLQSKWFGRNLCRFSAPAWTWSSEPHMFYFVPLLWKQKQLQICFIHCLLSFICYLLKFILDSSEWFHRVYDSLDHHVTFIHCLLSFVYHLMKFILDPRK